MAVFRDHYLRNSWGHPETVSGRGSTLEATKVITALLPKLISRYDVRTLVDAPCGDFNWMRLVDIPARYIGIDIVPDIIDKNNSLHANENRSFIVSDITRDPIPKGDLIICRDCLFHLSFGDTNKVINNIKDSGSRLLLTTTYPSIRKNDDIITGDYRPINLEKRPYRFPRPLLLEHEGDLDGSDKSIGLWRIADL